MSVVIGEFDCDALTTTVTLDTSGAKNGTPFDITVIRRAAGTTDQVSRQLVFLEPDVKETVTVALAPDAYNWVFVSGGNINANQDGPCGSYVLDPRATVAELDCTALQTQVTVDNTRSTDSVRFTLRRSSSGVAGEGPGYEESVLLAAGGVAVRVIPLVDDASNVVSVISDAPAGGILATRSSVCGELPVASVGALDCDALSTVVTLDNSRMPASTVYTVHSGEPLQLVERAVEVPPGEIAAISVSLVPNAFNEVRVNLSRRVVIAAASGVCGTWVDGPRASIGPLECGRDAAVTLDNSRSSARSAFLIQRTVAGDDHSDDARLVLGAGEVRVVPVTLEEGTITDVLVRARDEHGAVLASVEGPLCGLLTVGPVDCDTETFEVTLVNDDADHEYSREFFVSSTEFRMHRTAYHQEVRLAVGERRVLTVPVAGLLGGDLRLEEPGTMDGAVLYEEPVEVDCPAGADSSESPPASGSLAATGAGGLGRLVLAGVALFAVGGALILVATASRRNLHLRTGKEVART